MDQAKTMEQIVALWQTIYVKVLKDLVYFFAKLSQFRHVGSCFEFSSE